MAKPLVAIVGRPNVGKSMLFNKLTGKRLSIVEDTPGVTRDRLYAQAEWRGRTFDLVDTGGIEPGTDDQILSFMREQAEIAIASACVIIFVCDIRTGMTAADQEVAGMLQRSRKPVILAVNKMDSTGHNDPDMYEFYNLGLGDPYPVSAVHGHGTGDLLDACFEFFPRSEEEEEGDDVVKVAIIGKPNVGKSSLVNRILGQERVIVSDVAGTTRDAVDSYLENQWGKFLIIDHGHRAQRRVHYHDRRPGGSHRAGHQGGRAGPRGGQGLYYRGEQVGRHRKGRQDHAAHGGGRPPGPVLYDLRPGAVHLRPDGPAGG